VTVIAEASCRARSPLRRRTVPGSR
jgi:hypothetical protein